MRQLSPAEVEAIVIRVTKNPDIFVMVYKTEAKESVTIAQMAVVHKFTSLEN